MLASFVQETSTTTGTGNLTLAGAASNRRTVNAAFGTNSRFQYYVFGDSSSEWENGIGYLSASTTLVRETVFKSSNSDAAVSFSAGTKHVLIAPIDRLVKCAAPFQSATGSKYFSSPNWIGTANITMSLDLVYYVPYYKDWAGNVDAFVVNVITNAGTLMRCGLYEIDADGNPGDILLETGDMDPSTTGVKVGTVTSTDIRAGEWYYVAVCCNNASIILKGNAQTDVYDPILGVNSSNLNNSAQLTEANGGSWTTLPATATATPTLDTTSASPRVCLRKA